MKYQVKCPNCGENIVIARIEIEIDKKVELKKEQNLDEIDGLIANLLSDAYGYGTRIKIITYRSILDRLKEQGVDITARGLGERLRKLDVNSERKNFGTVAILNEHTIDAIDKAMGIKNR